jgi:hypothetical protein|tara:strand:+ start:598 stop:1395 length:798 start_codon:yes stop_codon:yes gene_type:complete
MKILLVGPTSKIQNYGLEYFTEAKQKGYNIIVWSGGINLFRDIGFPPDYYSFLDPLSMMWNDEIKKLKNSKIIKDTCLIVADMYDGIFYNKSGCTYYKLGYTCNKAEAKSNKLKNNFVNQINKNNFKKTLKIQPNSLVIDKVEGFVDFKKHFYLLTDPGKDTDKLTSFLIPLTFFYFKDVKQIKCLGFGDIKKDKTIGRYMDINKKKSPWVSSKQDFRFLQNYKKNIKIIDKFLKHENIQLNFEYENEYSKFMSYDIRPLKGENK